jgi:hypothetical protein
MIDHDRAEYLAASSVDWPLSDDEEIELQDHLRTCPSCRRMAAAMRSDAARLRELPRRDPPERVRHAVRAASLGRRSNTRLWLVLAAALIVALPVGGAIGLGALTNQPHLPRVSQGATTPSAAPSPTASPASSVSPSASPSVPGTVGGTLGRTWTRVGASDLLGSNGQVLSFGSGSLGVLAVGSSRGNAAAWRSADGSRWSRATSVQGSAGAQIFDVAQGPQGAVAVGSLPAGGSAVWTSRDGLRWTRQEPAAFRTMRVTLLAVGEGGMIAAGDSPAAYAGRGRIWFSQDGQSWRQVLEVDHVQDVAAAHGRFVVIGCDVSARRCLRLQAWASTDGRTWTVGTVARPDATFSRVLSTTRGFMAAGADLNDPAQPRVMWLSTNGTSWQVVRDAPRLSGEDNRSFSGDVFGILALRVGSPSRLEVYTSTDGKSWFWAESTTTIRSLGVASAVPSGGVVLSGTDDQGPSIWLARPGG